MKLSTYIKPQAKSFDRASGVVSAYKLIVSSAYKHNTLGLGGFKFGGKNASDIYVAGAPAVEYVSAFRVLANMYHVNRSSIRVARRSLKQLGCVYNSVSTQNRPQMFDTVGLSYRSIFGFARRIFFISSKFQYLRRTPAARRAISENKLFSTPFVQYRRLQRGLVQKQIRKKWRNYIFIGRLWRSIHKLRRMQKGKDRDAWWQSSWTRAYKTRLKPTCRSYMADLAYMRSWFNNAFMRSMATRGSLLRTYTRWDHEPSTHKGRNWINPIYFDRRDRNRRFPRTWRKTRRYVRLKSERTAWINDAAGYNYRSSRSFVALRSGATFDGSYSQLTLVAGTRSILYVPARLAMRRMFNIADFMRKWRRIERRGFRKALRFYRKFDRKAVFLPKVPRNPQTGAFSMAPRLGYARLNRFVSAIRPEFRSAKLFKVRHTGEWFYRIGAVARKLFYKRLRHWASTGSSTKSVMKLRRYCGIGADSWTGVALGYFKYQVGSPTLRSKNYRDFRIALRNVMSINYPGFFIERNLTRWTTYDLAFFNPVIDVSDVQDHYMQWTAGQKILKIHRLLPGQSFPRLVDAHLSTKLTDRLNRRLLGRKLGFVDKFLAYSILNTKSSVNVTNKTPYRRVIARAATRTPVTSAPGFGSTRSLRRDRFTIGGLFEERSEDLAAMASAEGIAVPNPGRWRTLGRSFRCIALLDSATISRRGTKFSNWVPTAFGLKRVGIRNLNNLGSFYTVEQPSLTTPRLTLANVTPSKGLGRFKDRNRKRKHSVWLLKNPILGAVGASTRPKYVRKLLRRVTTYNPTPRRVVKVVNRSKSRFNRFWHKAAELAVSFSIGTKSNTSIDATGSIVGSGVTKHALQISPLLRFDFFKRYFLTARAQRNATSTVVEPVKTYFLGSENPVLDIFYSRYNRELQSRRMVGYGRLYLDAFKAKVGRQKPQPKHLPQKNNQRLNKVLAVFGDESERKQSRKERRRDFFKTHQKKGATQTTERSQNWRAKNRNTRSGSRPGSGVNHAARQAVGHKTSQNKKN